MKRSKLSGWLDIIGFILLSISQLIIVLFFPLLYRIAFLTISSIISFIIILAAISCFLERHIKTRKIFIKGKYDTKIVHDLGPISPYINAMCSFSILLVSFLFSIVFVSENASNVLLEGLKTTHYPLILTFWIESGILTIIAAIIYNEELSEKEQEKLDKKRKRKKEKLERYYEKKDKERIEKWRNHEG